ncbi:MAG: hypothetical protein E6772_12500 [Dysgonomonas sp.]|nr:hypothetical protein [Dysgonomonas sp.]
MRNFFRAMVIALVVTFVTSCSGDGKIDFTDAGSVAKIGEKLGEVVPADATVMSVAFNTDDRFAPRVTHATIHYYPKGETKTSAKVVYFTGTKPVDWKSVLVGVGTDVADGKKLSEIDFDKIAGYVNKGKEIMASDEVDLPFSGVEKYTINVDTKTHKMVHKFTLTSKGDSKKKRGHAGNKVVETEYYALNFEVDDNGEVILK